MPRLTKKQAIQYYGRNLPTPTIEKMTLYTVNKDDSIYKYLDFEDIYKDRKLHFTRLESPPSSGAPSVDTPLAPLIDSPPAPLAPPDSPPAEMLDRDQGFRYLTRVDVDLSFYMSTWEGFNPEELSTELFSRIEDEYGEGESLYMSLLIDITAPSDIPRKVDLVSIFDLYADGQRTALQEGTRGDNEYWSAIATAAMGSNEYILSMPLSDFFEIADVTAEYDTDNNVVLKISNIKIPVYISHFNDLQSLRIYAASTSGHPYSIAANEKLDPRTYALNFSDFTYEDILKNGSLATFGEPVFVDADGIQYPNKVLASLNKKYYKTDDLGHEEIIGQISQLMQEYTPYAPVDEELEETLAETQYVLQAYGSSVGLLQNLNKAAQLFSVTLEDSRAVRYHDRLRALINNADGALRTQPEVVKRIYRNYRVVDSRELTLPEFSQASFDSSLTDRDFLYNHLYHTNIANYVPMEHQPASFPGQSELPMSPSERIENAAEAFSSIRADFQTLVNPAGDNFSFTGYVDENGERVNHFDNATEAITRWVYDTWSARFIKGSQSEHYRFSENHDGAHYYCMEPQKDSPYNVSNTYVENSEFFNNRNGPIKPPFYWHSDKTLGGKRSKKYAPNYFRKMVQDSQPDAGTEYWAGGDTKGGIYRPRSRGNLKKSDWEGSTTFDPQATIDIFGYVPHVNSSHGETFAGLSDYYNQYFATGDTPDGGGVNGYSGLEMRELMRSRPDNTPAYAHPSQDDYGTPAKVVYKKYERGDWELTKRWHTHYRSVEENNAYMDPFFWSAASGHDILSLYRLAQLDQQLIFYVPKSGLNADGVREVVEFAGNTPQFVGMAGIDDDDTNHFAQQMSSGLYEDNFDIAKDYLSSYFEEIGGVRALNANSSRCDKTNLLYFSEVGRPASPSDGVLFYYCSRRKYKNLRDDIKTLVDSAMGIEDGDGDDAGANALTRLDEYIQEGPEICAENASSRLFSMLDSMPYDRINSEAERDNQAMVFKDRFMAMMDEEIESYFNNSLCKIYVATVIPDPEYSYYEVDRWAGSVDRSRFGFSEARAVCSVDYSSLNSVSANDRPVLPYGLWEGAPSNRTNTNTFVVNFGKDLVNQIKEHIRSNQFEILQLIRQYLNKRQELEGVVSDVGVHSALAEFDIVVKKYGYFFFDLEKYIRKQSHMSKVMNVDRFLSYFPRGKGMTNLAIKFNHAMVTMDNFQDTPGNNGAPAKRTVKLALIKDKSTNTAMQNPTSFSEMTFESPVDEINNRPYAYRKINAVQNINFAQITEYTSGSILADQAFADATPSVTGESLGSAQLEVNTGGAGSAGGGGYNVAESPAFDLRGDASLNRSMLDMIQDAGFTLLRDVVVESNEGEAAAAQEEEMEAAAEAARMSEVDITALMNSEHAPVDLHSKLVMRNYIFPGFNNAALLGGKSWRKDYRMMMFQYQTFIDDDLAFEYNNPYVSEEGYFPGPDGGAGIPEDPPPYVPAADGGEGDLADYGRISWDNMNIRVSITDESTQTVYAMVRLYHVTYQEFIEEYYDFAEEACAFNAFDQQFNKFFVDSMIGEYPDPPDTPWHRMVALNTIYENIFTDTFGGDRILMNETSNNILERIRPETGNLLSLRNFKEKCEGMHEMLTTMQATMRTDPEFLQEGFSFTFKTIIGTPVIDHIGDYSSRATDDSYTMTDEL